METACASSAIADTPLVIPEHWRLGSSRGAGSGAHQGETTMAEPIAAYWIMLAGALLPYPLVIVAKAGKTYDNADPRNPAALSTPLKRAAFGAHANQLEVFPLFAAAVLLAAFRHAPAATVDVAAWVWLAARLVYIACYLRGLASLRSLIWGVATAASVWILVTAITHGTGV
jgi:uncharacterized MAPEG superfamily protein